jgi:hypothetical protein
MFEGLTPYKGINTRVRLFQSVGDIMSGIIATHKAYAREYDKIAPRFDKGTNTQVLRSIYAFLLENTHYKIEPNDKQTLRSPAAILALGGNPAHGLDCKSYSLFIGGVLDALNRRGRKFNWCYRFASYKMLDKIPHHVFVVVNPDTTNEIFIDPVIKPFNYKKAYFYKIDKYPPTMALYSVSGIGRRRGTNRQERQANKAEAKAKIVNKLKKAGKVAVRFSPPTVAARNSFLLLVKLNAFKLADNLKKAETKAPGDLQKFWEKLGGSWNALKKNINIGGRKQGARIAGDPVVTPTLIASAVPILVKIREFLKKLGLTEDDIKKLSKLAQGAIKTAIDKKAENEAAAQESEISIEPSEVMAEANDMPADAPSDEAEYESTDSEDGIGNILTTIKTNPLPWVAGAAAAYFIFKPKTRRK